MVDDHTNTCTHEYQHIAQSIQDLSDNTQQNSLHSLEDNASSFTHDNVTPCDFNITDHHLVTENANDTSNPCMPKQSGIHLQQKHMYCYIVGLGLNCKFIDLFFKCSFIKFIEISLYLDFIVSEIICKQTDTLNQELIHQRQF